MKVTGAAMHHGHHHHGRRRGHKASLTRLLCGVIMVTLAVLALLHGHLTVNSALDAEKLVRPMGNRSGGSTHFVNSWLGRDSSGSRTGEDVREQPAMVEEYLPVEKLGRDLVMPQQWRAIPNGEVVNEPNGQSKKFNYVHMGMIAELPDERLVLAFQASAVLEAAEDQRIWYTVSQDKSGRTWGKLMPLHPETRRAAQWAPVLHWSEAGGGSLIMFHAESDPHCLREGGKNGKQPRRYSVGGNILMSKAPAPGSGSQAIEWSTPRVIYHQKAGDKPIPKVIANRMLVLSSGEWILPFWRQRSYQVCDTKSPHSAGVLRSADQGETWRAYGDLLLPSPMSHWVIEGSAVELVNTTIMLVLRSTEGFLYRSLSMDQGVTWGHVARMGVPNPDAKANAIRLRGPSGQLILAYNDHDRPFHGMARGRTSVSGKRRDTLMIAVSSDSGNSWKKVARVDPPIEVKTHGASTQAVNMMFHYPTLLQRRDEAKVLMAYSRSYYPDRSLADPPYLDGIWLAEIELYGAAQPGRIVPA